jgi:predicted Zn finger-like uncharacterized protein
MYTQCPDCGTAFRVTAEVLKQAAGKVRCGGCGNAFNALEFLSENKPGQAPKPQADKPLPELKPDPGEFEDGAVPKSISAEQSAALLKTLDDLAGSDIRLEDTGVEWRLVDEEDDGEVNTGAEPGEEISLEDTGSIRWFIDDSPTPIDEQLSAEPGEIDAPEVFEDAAAGEQMRFDDDTPLPDDFDFNAGPADEPEPIVEARVDPSEFEAEQVDLALGEPEDWEDLLEEVDEPTTATAEAGINAEAEDEAAAASATDDENVSPDESVEARPLPDVDEQFATQAEAMGIDLSGMHARLQKTAGETDEEPEAEESSIDDDLIAAAFEVEAEARAKREARERDTDEAVGDEIAFEASDDDEVLDDEIAFEASDDDEVLDDEVQAVAGEDEEFEIDLHFADDDLIEARDRELVSSTEEDAKLAAELGLDDSKADGEPDIPEPVFLPESEEEKTVNMMIDQDLLAIAVEDEEGFTSTIVQKQPDDDDGEDDVAKEPADPGKADPLVETIIMEGDFIRDADEEERLERAREESGDPELGSAAAADIEELPKEEEQATSQPVNFGVAAGIAALILALVLQGVHQMRESLVTLPQIGEPVASLYRAIGRPVTPDWDISGWRFEATKGSTDDGDAVLTIYSRVGNKSLEPLPYPLISVSLTDRYEDIIGSKVLEPGEYLAGDLDTRRAVAPGNTFSAVISIEEPFAEATGFKLNVCYRQAGGKLKCAIDDFK